jgi:hypothetical protein
MGHGHGHLAACLRERRSVIPPVRCPVIHLVTTVPRLKAVDADSAGGTFMARLLPIAMIGTAQPFQGRRGAGCGLPTARRQAAMLA